MVICCRSLLLQDCLLLPFVSHRPLFLMSECARLLSAHMAPRGRVRVPCSFSKHANVLQSGGSPLHRATGSPPPPPMPRLSSPITEQNLAPRTSSKHTANGTFIYLPSCPRPQQPSFTGIRSAISRSPMATVGLVNQGDNFLMMSPCHGDRRRVAKR